MPFHWNISEPRKTFERNKNTHEIDRSDVANRRVVASMRNLLQLIKLADDIFTDIENECRSVYERTTKLNIKIQLCQGIVDKLNAKEVRVPRGTLSDNPTDSPPFQYSGAQVSNFSNFRRPPVIERLRDSADGPSPPVIIPSGMVASQVEAGNRTHIYCTAVKIKDAGKHSSLVASRKSNASKKTMSSNSKMPSNVVAIDVSGQPFSRMASLRRSLIHVDFLIRRKQKKDKRRNTVSEGEVKETLGKMVNADGPFPLPNGLCSYQQMMATERNNNKSISKPGCVISAENGLSDSEIHLDETVWSKQRKPKSHIPISTLSAAMNVAVEMRQSDVAVVNGTTNHASDHNGVLAEKDKHQEEESWATYKKRLQEKYKTLTSNKKDLSDTSIGKEGEVSSTASSENIDPQDSLATSTESETFFISSDESDEEYSDVPYFQENYGSSTSLGTASDGSLNSLLSENGTEMTSSTGTLTSVGQEHLLTPPPPPPPMILSATLKNKDLIDKVPEMESSEIDTSTLKGKNNTKVANGIPKKVKKIKSPKSSKPLKSDFRDMHRNLTENSKNIFTSLVSLKDKNKKSKDVVKKKSNESTHQPAFDMYGNSSTKEKEIPTFIKENISPSIQNEKKSDMKSFFVKDRPYQLSNNEMVNKLNLPLGTDKNSPSSDNSSASESKKNHAVNSIPPKYEHQVTVKPIQRSKEVENKIILDKSPAERENIYGTTSRQSWWGTEKQIYAPRVRPNPPVTPERSKAARVVLDYNGRVIYSTNSLDRKHYSLGSSVNMYNSVQSATCDTHLKDMELNRHSCQENHRQPISQACPLVNYSSYMASPRERAATFSTVPWQTLNNLRPNETYHLEQAYDFSDDISSSKWQSRKSENTDIFVPKRMDAGRPYLYERHSPETCSNHPPNHIIRDPNISGLPVQENNTLSRHNVSLHSKRMEEESENIYPRHSNAFCLSPTKDSGNILNKSPQSTMSTEDLFAVIHNCKKRMNIKTDPDITSSRSSSPSYIRPSPSKSILAETGFLSPRSQTQLETGGDRKSWPDFRPVESICYERKCLASDRLGPTKPTSMHDFKMLLLQARTSSQISGPRKSAVEMLKVPLNQNTKNTMPQLLSPRNYFSMSVPNSPSAEYSSIYNGHSTVPFKRGNRVRASLQPRYIMYPPIFEDCSEDSENNNLEKERLG